METILRKIRLMADDLLKKEPVPYTQLGSLPVSQGVYIIRDKKGIVVYVGKGKNLKRRIKSQHFSGGRTLTTSILRRKLAQKHNLKSGPSVKRFIIKNYLFSWKEIADKDETALVEAVLIAYLRQRYGAPLLND